MESGQIQSSGGFGVTGEQSIEMFILLPSLRRHFFPQSKSHICAKYSLLAFPTPADINGQLKLQIPFNGPEAGGTSRVLACLTSGGCGSSYRKLLEVIQIFKYLKL